jgi:hypothetical protein
MKFNAHIRQSKDNVAEIGKGITSLTDGEQVKYWDSDDIVSIKSDRQVSNSSINSDTQAFKDSFIQRVFSNKKIGSNYYYDKFFSSSGSPMSQAHELPTSGQMVDYLLNKDYGLVYNHIGNHLGAQSVPTNTEPSGSDIFNFAWVWETPYTGPSKPTGWDDEPLVNKINWVFKNFLDYG